MDMAGDAVTRPVRRCATTDADEERKDASVPVELTVRDGGDVRVPRVEGMPEAGYDEGELVACEQRETPISRKTLEPRTSAVDTRKKKAAMSSRDETGRREDEQRTQIINPVPYDEEITEQSSDVLVELRRGRRRSQARRYVLEYGIRPTRAADGRNEPKTLKMLSESAEDSCAEPYGSDLWHASEVSGRVEHVGAADENRTAEIQYPDVML
ncbi:hypothetical protein PC118_g20424 [Phytophthora cactorum]|uniref:Uncharacterized protein n=1 Tax=Phytophthora cactorum TaxID=29920 RepID=A0A8T1EZ90_9STRA|nr:hypothetical protein PC118_g20424 [Phytophthora cactorum]